MTGSDGWSGDWDCVGDILCITTGTECHIHICNMLTGVSDSVYSIGLYRTSKYLGGMGGWAPNRH